MAKRKTSTTRTIVVPAKQAAPVIKVSAPRAAPVKRRKGGRRRRSSGIGGGGSFTKTLVGCGIGGAVYGYIEKHWGPNIPSLPIIGKSGTIAVAAYFAHKNGFGGEISRDTAIAAAVIAGYSFGTTGKVSGNVAPQVSGVAAQV